MRYIYFILLISPFFASAQEVDTVLELGEVSIPYTEEVSFDGGTLLYTETESGDVLVASTHNVDEDDTDDIWLQYIDGAVVLEAHDTTNDGVPDTFISLLPTGELSEITGAGANELVPPTTKQFLPVVTRASDGINTKELVGDLSDITIEEEDYSWMFFVILLVVGGGLYFFLKRQK